MSASVKGRRTGYGLLMTLCLLLGACSGGGNSDTGGIFGGGDGGDNAPQAPTTLPGMDLDAAQLSPNGCLDLSLVMQRLRTFSEGAVIREHTSTFTMENRTVDGKTLQHPRNMSALSAFASFSINEASSPLFASTLPDVTQDGCRSVTFTDRVGGQTVYSIDGETLVPSSVRLKTYVAKGESRSIEQDVTYILKSARELEIVSVAPVMDRCPEHQKVQATTVRTRVWGTQPELQNVPVLVAVDLLRKISIAVRDMPRALRDLVSGADESAMVTANQADLMSLRSAEIDREVNRCPYEAKPPGTDEAPPAEETLPSDPATPL